MTTSTTSILDCFQYQPGPEQIVALQEMEMFINRPGPTGIFMLSGSAGTGKTSLIQALCSWLQDQNMPCILTAPTGRAAKIISTKTGQFARTVHSLIYTPQPGANHLQIKLVRRFNTLQKPAVYIVDEASMLSDNHSGGNRFLIGNTLLHDLISYVREGHEDNRIIFIGDPCQLPPVGADFSPALDAEYLRTKFNIAVQSFKLKEVVRQTADSYILQNAVRLRERMELGNTFSGLHLPRIQTAMEALEYYRRLEDFNRTDKVTFIALSNRDVNAINTSYRHLKYKNPELLMENDAVMIHQNWLGSEPGSLLLKGEPAIIKETYPSTIEKICGINFMDISLRIIKEGSADIVLNSKVNLDVLYTENGDLNPEAEKALYHDRMAKNKRFRESQRLCDDPYLGAFRLRFGYALTCHKAQGGEWDEVILHPYYRKDDYRWQYTAVTRGRKEVFGYYNTHSMRA